MANVIVGRKSGFIQRSGRMRRETVWFGLAEINTILAGANSATMFQTLNAAALALRPFTVVRTHINWFIRSDQTGALEAFQTGLGLAVVSDQAAAIGVSAVPTPYTDLGSDLWFFHQIQTWTFLFVSGIGVHPTGGSDRDFDSKAMRKVDVGQDIAITLENSALSLGSNNLTSGRMLVKLH